MLNRANYQILSEEEERIGKAVVHTAYNIHKNLGPGLLESVYELCFCHELTKSGLSIKKQQPVPIIYDGIVFDVALRLDVLVEDLIICELKATETILPVFGAQLLSYLRLSNKRLGFLINFNVPIIKEGIRRIVL
ncbi:MAG: GxxExxY protein [Candidatus Margulisbacteria bacterium]|nr:GxxExxY protein [Candidatus Margulisiibacteriota bacterium]